VHVCHPHSSSCIYFICRPAKLRAFLEDQAARNGELLPGERRVSGRRRDDQYYNDSKDALLNLRHDVVTRMLNCLKILEEAGSKGVLKVRSLETMKKTRAVKPPKPGQPRKTGITVPDTVYGQPVAASIGVQKHSDIAAYLQKKTDDYVAKYIHICPLASCQQRCASVPGLKTHFRIMHAGIAFPENCAAVPAVVAAVPASAATTAAVSASADTTAAASASAAGSVSKRVKAQHNESDYEVCSLCPNSRYLKRNRGVHLASESHKTNATNAATAK
jgi:hypothetical protein